MGTGLIPAFEKEELDIVVAGRDAYQGSNKILFQEPLIWVISKDADSFLHKTLPLVLLPSPCHFRKIVIESLEKTNRKWKIVYTGTSTASIQMAVQAGMGVHRNA